MKEVTAIGTAKDALFVAALRAPGKIGKIGAPPTLPDFFLTHSSQITYRRFLRGEP